MNTDPTEQPPDQAPPRPMVRLDDAYQSCFLGITVSPSQRPRFAYSLTRLLRQETFRTAESGEDAARSVYNMVEDIERLHPDNAPVFIDDRVSMPEPSLIIRPNGFNPTIVKP